MGNSDWLARDGLLNIEAPSLSELASTPDKAIYIATCGCGLKTDDKKLTWCPRCNSALLWRRVNLRDKRKR
jgi:hypothetical protein